MTIEEMMAEQFRQDQNEYDAMELPVVTGTPFQREMFLPMSDGVKLQTLLLYPDQDMETNGKSYPVILQRSPYYAARTMYEFHGNNLARHGFVYIVQFCRGTGESEGKWEPNVNERSDGLDTLAWLEKASWAGNVGFWGDSYLGLTGWCMADAVTEKVKGMYLGVYGTDRFTSAYCKGAFRQDVLTSWAMENAGFPVSAGYEETYRFRPQVEVDESLWGKKVSWYRDWITATKEDDPYWQQGFWKQLKDIPGKVKIPILVSEGWYDHHLGSALKSYENLNPTVRENATLLIGSWNHHGLNCLEWTNPQHLQNSEVKFMTEWFTSLLVKGEVPKKKVRVYIIGQDEWREFPAWPMPVQEIKTFFLSAGGALESDTAKAADAECSYVYDPENPVPSHGAESMLHTMEEIGSLYQPDPNWRDDVVSFVSGPLESDLLIGGTVRVKLFVSSDCEDTAFCAKLMRVGRDGKAVNIRSSITSLSADHKEGYVPGTKVSTEIVMWDIAFEVKAGEKLRLDISSSDFPQYSVHSNYPGIWSLQEKTRIAHQKIFCGPQDSRVEIPILG